MISKVHSKSVHSPFQSAISQTHLKQVQFSKYQASSQNEKGSSRCKLIETVKTLFRKFLDFLMSIFVGKKNKELVVVKQTPAQENRSQKITAELPVHSNKEDSKLSTLSLFPKRAENIQKAQAIKCKQREPFIIDYEVKPLHSKVNVRQVKPSLAASHMEEFSPEQDFGTANAPNDDSSLASITSEDESYDLKELSAAAVEKSNVVSSNQPIDGNVTSNDIVRDSKSRTVADKDFGFEEYIAASVEKIIKNKVILVPAVPCWLSLSPSDLPPIFQAKYGNSGMFTFTGFSVSPANQIMAELQRLGHKVTFKEYTSSYSDVMGFSEESSMSIDGYKLTLVTPDATVDKKSTAAGVA